MIIGMERTAHTESYCSACDTWSPGDAWETRDIYVDDEWMDSSAVCPRCGHGFPEHDPPMREAPG